MRSLKKIPLFLFLLPLFFCLHGSVENFGYVTASGVIKLCLIILAVLLLFFFIIKYFTKDLVFSALIVFYIGVWNLFFGALQDWLKSRHILLWLGSYSVLLPVLLVSTITWIILLKRNKNFQNKLLYYFNILLLIYCAYDISILIIKSFNHDKKTQKTPVAFNYAAVKSRPNVYYLLFDGYPGYKSLKDRFGYANDSLYSYFNKNGFGILPTFSNYNLTYFSLSAVFNMQYTQEGFNSASVTEKDYLHQMVEVKNGKVFSIFSKMGYSIKNLSIFNVQNTHSFANNETVPSDIELFTYKILYRKFIKDVGWLFITGKYQVPFLKKIFFLKDEFNKGVERNLYNIIGEKSTNPIFVYSHFLLPHPPIYVDSTGNYLPDSIIDNRATILNKNYYLGYIKYTNSKIISISNQIIKADPGAVIIVMSDHGYTFGNITPSYFFDNICAVRLGDFICSNYYPSKFSGVNFFRYLFNCRYNQNFPYLKDTIVELKDYLPPR
ncbi:MAG: hypothetical protein JWN83_3017 [Chitinophagaceae bacterium]|nr:hypothetical protein [Chitinophagaceae bacterium]